MNSAQPKKLCLLTGASGRLGEVFCARYGNYYDIVGVYCRNTPKVPSQLEWAVDPLNPHLKLPENNSAIFAIQGDLLNQSDIEHVVDVTLERFGRIDLLVNAAAYFFMAPMIDGPGLLDSFDRQFRINVLAPLAFSTLIAERFWRHRVDENRQMNRSIVNISSTSGVYIFPGLGQGLYSASKAALNYLTLHMAEELAAIGIRANTLAPTTFPQLIATETVADGIPRLGESQVNGRMLVLDVEGERWA